MENKYENKFYEGILVLGAISSLIAGIALKNMDFKPLTKFLNPECKQEQVQNHAKQTNDTFNLNDFMCQRFGK